MRIVLTGPKGSGKSTIGHELGVRMQMTVVETDDVIEQLFTDEYGKKATCREICREYGEPFFREIERRAVAEALQQENCIICTGGQTVTLDGCREALLDAGFIVLLKVPFRLIWKRIERQGYPPFFPEDNPREWFEKRIENVYRLVEPAADMIFNVGGLSVDQAVTELEQRLRSSQQL